MQRSTTRRIPNGAAAAGPHPSSSAAGWRRLVCRVWPLLPSWARRLAVRVSVRQVSLGVAAVVQDSTGAVLLAHHTYRPLPWDLPAGFVRRGEEPVAALQRELREELGVPALIGPLLAATTAGSHLTLCYRATLSGVPQADGVEIDGLRYVAVGDIPALVGRTPAWLTALEWPGAAARAVA